MFRIGKVNVPVMLKILFCRPFGACYLVSLTRGFTPGYVLSALRACCRAKGLFALQRQSKIYSNGNPGVEIPHETNEISAARRWYVTSCICEGQFSGKIQKWLLLK